MAMNMYKLRWMGGQLVLAFIPTLIFFSLTTVFSFWIGLLAFLVSIPISQKIATNIVRHPMLDYAFGDGVLTFTFDSTGVIAPILSKIAPGKVVVLAKGRKGDKEVDTVFDRNAMMHVNQLIKAGELVEAVDDDGNEYKCLILPKNAWEYRFSFLQYPAFLFNKNLGTFITKDWFGKEEKKLFKKHLILELIYKIDEVSSYIRDFARYVAEQMKPKSGIFQSKWLWIILLLLGLGVVLYFVFSSGGGIGGLISGGGGGIIQPKG